MRMARVLGAVAMVAMLAAGTLAWAQEKSEWTYPVIPEYGPAWPLPNAAVQPVKGSVYKAIFDITKPGEKPDEPAPGLVHAARTYNVFAAGGVAPKNLKVVIVMHGPGGIVAMNNDTYRAKFKADNPNAQLLADLKKAGAEIYLCGQTLHQQKFEEKAMLPDVKLATSAMIVLLTYQNQGYAMMPF